MAESSISVAVRVRPFSPKEAALLAPVDTYQPFLGDGGLLGSAGAVAGPSTLSSSPNKYGSTAKPRYLRPIVRAVDDKVLIFDPLPEGGRGSTAQNTFSHGQKKPRDVRYAFDRVFDESCTQEDVFANTTKPLLDGILSGFNASVFAYGATGCGKTHTISGTAEDPGVIFLTMRELYQRVEDNRDESDVQIRLSYLEIYNESIRDLLSPVPTPAGQGLMLREDAANRISVVGITEHIPESPEHVLSMIQEGNQRRTISPTEANAVSSRSHAVLQLNVTQRPRTANTVMETTSASLNIIDLAGSERAAATQNNGARMKEGANINKSLLALGNCINALCQSGGRNGRHIPYRNSKLTRLLKFSLGGNCKTVMIVCVSPSSAHYDETHNTLKYANQAKNIRTKVSRNMLNVDRHVAQYVQAIHELREEVQSLKAKLAEKGTAEGPAEKRRKTELTTEAEDAKSRLRVQTASIKALVVQKAGVEGLLAAARLRCDALQARLTEVNRQAAPYEQKGVNIPADLQEQQQMVKRMIARQEGIINDRILQADQAALAKALQTFRSTLSAAANNIKFDKPTEEHIRTMGDAMVAEVEALRSSKVSESLSKQLMIGAGTAADLSVLCAREITLGQEAGTTITQCLKETDEGQGRETLQTLATQLSSAVADNAASLYRAIGLKVESGAFASSTRSTATALSRRTRSSVSATASSAARKSVALRRPSALPPALSHASSSLLGASRSPRKSAPRRSVLSSRKSFYPRPVGGRSSGGTSSSSAATLLAVAAGNAASRKSFRWADEAGEGKLSATQKPNAPPSHKIRSSLSSTGDEETAQGGVAQTSATIGDGVPSSSAEWEDESREAAEGIAKSEHETVTTELKREPLGLATTNVVSDSKKRAGSALFSTTFLRKKASQDLQQQRAQPSSDAAMDVDGAISSSFSAFDLDGILVPTTDSKTQSTNSASLSLINNPKRSALAPSTQSSSSSDDLTRLSHAYSAASVRSSPYRKPSIGNDSFGAKPSGPGPVRNGRSRGSGSSSGASPSTQADKPLPGKAYDGKSSTGASSQDSQGGGTFPRRTVRPSASSATLSSSARNARPSSMLSAQQPFPLRKVPTGGFNNPQQ